ncbi:WXG100 family type VII secretion target [Micromonospora sp. DT31]|uniref:WXG100 family type VII secretion target n=1 Tax=Micromonospora sp. DT31 TaxID=3393434 RepID=UPI003CF99131
MSAYGDPDELDRLASRIAARAQEIRDWRDRHSQRVQAAHWVSTAADAYRKRVHDDGAELGRVADDLERAADLLHAHAQEVRETLARIAAIERAAAEWFERKGHELLNQAEQAVGALRRAITAPWEGWPYRPGTLPPSGDRKWLDVGDLLKSAGAL